MPLEKGQAPLEKGQTYIEHFPAREDALLISESGCVHPEVMVLNTNPLVLFTISQDILILYGQILNQTVNICHFEPFGAKESPFPHSGFPFPHSGLDSESL